MGTGADRTPGGAVRLTDRVTAGLVQMIADAGMKPGDKLPAADRLCERFAVSRTVVREAIASLKAEGLLRSLRGSGVYVSEPARMSGASMVMQAPQDIADVLDFMELRMSVEIEAAGLAAERRTETNLLRMEQAMSQFAWHRSQNTLAVEADRAFHSALADATNNRRFRLFVDEMGERLIPRGVLGADFSDETDKAAFLETIAREHRRILDAVAAREPDAARQAMRAHLEGGRRRYREYSLAHYAPESR